MISKNSKKIVSFFKEKLSLVWNNFGKKQMIIFISLVSFLILLAVVLLVRCSLMKKTASNLCFSNNMYNSSGIQGLNHAARSGKLKNGAAYYKFSPKQIENITDFFERSPSTQISVEIKLLPVDDGNLQNVKGSPKYFYFGFLEKKDFDSDGKLIEENGGRISAGCDLRSIVSSSPYSFKVSLALKKENNNIPSGVFISSMLPIEIGNFCVDEAKVGFDFTGDVPYFAVSPNGGSFMKKGSVDFTGASLCFSAENTAFSLMPKIEVSIASRNEAFPSEYNSENISESAQTSAQKKTKKVSLNAGGESISFYVNEIENDIVLQTSLLKTSFCAFDFEKSPYVFKKILMKDNEQNLLPSKNGKLLQGVPVDPGLLLGFSNSYTRWRNREYEIYKWDRFPSVLIFDTRNYKIQDQFFKRLAFFAEKTGYKGSIHKDEVIKDFHGFNAYDYSAKTMADFFNKANESDVLLNDKENLLKEILLVNGVIIQDGGEYKAGKGAVASVSLEIQSGIRYTLCAHELFHGLFFIDEEFRNVSAAALGSIDQTSYDFIINYFKSQSHLGYDTEDNYLMTNEFMAYIMQRHLNDIASSFVHIGNRFLVMQYMPELCDWVKKTKGQTFEDTGKFFESFVYDKWGLACGRVGLTVR